MVVENLAVDAVKCFGEFSRRCMKRARRFHAGLRQHRHDRDSADLESFDEHAVQLGVSESLAHDDVELIHRLGDPVVEVLHDNINTIIEPRRCARLDSELGSFRRDIDRCHAETSIGKPDRYGSCPARHVECSPRCCEQVGHRVGECLGAHRRRRFASFVSSVPMCCVRICHFFPHFILP